MKAPTVSEVFGRRPDRCMARCVRGRGSRLTVKQTLALMAYIGSGSISDTARRLKRHDKTIREHLAACRRKGAL